MQTTSFFSKSLIASLAAILLMATPLVAGLTLGDKAPQVEITKWVKGDSVDLEAKDNKVEQRKVIVLEFWATWCGPCITSIPHLTELQKKHKKDVYIIGVTKPDPQNSLEKVESFVSEQGDKMAYTVAFDGEGKTYESYMRSAEQSGIPTAFIVDPKGRLAWLGHPMKMDKPLEEILAGTFDIENARRQLEVSKRLKKLYREFRLLTRKGQVEDAGKVAKEFVTLAHDDAAMLNNLAWTLLTDEKLEGKFHGLALKAAARCDELTDGGSWMYVDTLALAKFKNGAAAEAVELQKRAMELARKANVRPETLDDLEKRLKLFEEAVK